MSFGYEEIPLLKTVDKEGKAPRERIKDSSHLRSIFVKMRDDDMVNAANRAEHQALLDNEPPYPEEQLREANMSGMTNLNFGGAEQQLERAMAPYYRLIQSPEDLVSVKTLYGPEDERSDLNTILSEEISRTIRNSEMFGFQTLLFVQKFVKDGLGVGYFPDEDDWRYRGAGLGQFFFDRQRFPCEEDQEIVCATEDYTVTRLFATIDEEEGEEESNWNKKAVIEAIQEGTNENLKFDDWERLQDELKNNDIFASQVCPPVPVVHGWIKEFDGTWSHYITTEEAVGKGKKFLYKCRSKYRSLSESLVIFPYGLGTNAKIHGLRGLIFKIFPHEQQRNRSLSRLIDQGFLASSVMLKAETEEALATTGLQYLGNTAVLGPDWDVSTVAMPDLQRSVIPSIEMMDRIRNDRVAGYNSDNVFDGDQRKTKFEVTAHLEDSAQLSDAAMDFFYSPHTRLMQQTVRRMSRKDYVVQDPGGREILDLQLRLVKRGVPLQSLFRIDHKATQVTRAVGAGSASAKTLAIQRLEKLYPRMDDVGQAAYNRMEAADTVGSANADTFFPRDGKVRTTQDTNIAILETNDLLEGKEVPVQSSDKHLAHAREHIKPLMEGWQVAEETPDVLAEMAVKLRLLYDHTAEHVDKLSGDPATQEIAADLREIMQQVGEVIVNGLKEAKKQAENQAEEAGGQGGQEGPDPEMIRETDRHRQKMLQSQEAHEQKMQQQAQAAEMKNAIADNTAASQIARTRAAQQAQLTQPTTQNQ